MSITAHITTVLAGVFLLGAVVPCAAQNAGGGDKDRQIRTLELQLKKSQNQYQTLARDLATSKKRESEMNKSLNDLRLRFAALGDNLLNGGQEAILEAVKNAEVLDKRNRATENAALNLMANMREYLRTAIAADPDARVRLETSILDIAQYIADNPGSSYLENAGYEQTGYFNRKYIARKGDLNIGDAALTNPDNYRAIRYADVLLMAAEALNRGSISDSRALGYLNEVRDRAMLPDLSTTGTNLTNDIYKERRVELVGEGHRFFDLVRTGRAAQEIDGFQLGKHELFPIPIEEILLTGNRWLNNPGY